MRTMNTIKALAVLLFASCFCYAQTPETFSGTFTEGLHELCKPGQVIASPTPQDNLNVSGSANVIVRSATGITLKQGFRAGGWTSGGGFMAKIGNECKLGYCGGYSDIVNTTEENYPFNPLLGDRFGNTFTMYDVLINTEAIEGEPRNVLLCQPGYFDLYFETGSGMEITTDPIHAARRAVVCAVFEDISNFIQSPLNLTGERVNVWFRDIGQIVNSPSTSGVLGAASPYYVLPPPNSSITGIVDNVVWTTINSGIDGYTNVFSPLSSGGFFHNFIALNFENINFNWNLLENPTGANEYDLYSVVLHEAIHALGFSSQIDFDGTSKFNTGYEYFTRYDMFLKTQSGQNLITNNGSCSLYQFGFNPALGNPNAILSPNPTTCGGSSFIPYDGSLDNTNCNAAIEYAGSINQPVYTPDCFERPSSLSHFEDECQVPPSFPLQPPISDNHYFVMSNANGAGLSFVKRYPTHEERSVLCDIGYAVNNSYGFSSFTNTDIHTYNGNCSGGIDVVGINDGITGSSYTFFVPVGTSTTPIFPLFNDYNANEYTCLEVIIGAGTPSNTSGTSWFSYTPTIQGVHILRYLPKNTTTGNIGNITYIYVYAYSGNCTPDLCDLVNNGGFENTNGNNCGVIGWPPSMVQLDCWDTYTQSTPDLMGADCAPIGTFSGPPLPNNNIIGLAATNIGTNQCESIQGLLSSPMTSGNYTLSFVARRPTGVFPAPFNIEFYGSTDAAFDFPLGFGFTPTGDMTLLHSEPIFLGFPWIPYSTTINYSGPLPLLRLIIVLRTNATPGSAYVQIDNVSIKPENSAAQITIPPIVCINQVVNVDVFPPGGTLTSSGSGVSFDANTGQWVFDATIAGMGTHTLSYEYINPTTGCSSVANENVTVINQNFDVNISASQTHYSCSVNQPLDLTLTAVLNPVIPATFEWSPGGSTTNPLIVPAPTSTTQYTVYVNGNNGCEGSATINITVEPNIVATVDILPDECDGNGVSATVMATNGTLPYSYLWSDGQITATATGLVTGTYSVIVTDAVGCIITVSDIVIDGCCFVEITSGNYINNVGPDQTFPFAPAPYTLPVVTGQSINGFQQFTVNGTWTINSDLTINNCEIFMAPGATIVVRPGTTLSLINGTYLHAGCGEMWESIVVAPGAELFLDNATIEDAIFGTSIWPQSNYQIKETTFNKNYVHVLFLPVSFFWFFNPPTGTITESRFLCHDDVNDMASNTTLLQPYTGFRTLAGVYSINGYDGLVVGGDAAGNYFENANLGIYCYKGTLESYGNEFREIVQDGNCQNNSFWIGQCGSCITSESQTNLVVGSDLGTPSSTLAMRNFFLHSDIGVYSQNDFNSINISHNSFDDVDFGIFVEHADAQANIMDNGMKAVRIGIYCRDNPGSILNIGDEENPNSITIDPINFFGGALGHGIIIQETTPPSFWNIDALHYMINSNSISNAVGGIWAENVLTSPWNSGIAHNLVTINNVSNGNASGIVENFVLGSVIADNNVSTPSINNTNLTRSGIRMNSTIYNWLFCNTTHDVGNGLHFANTFAPTYITRNLMENSMRGFFLETNPFNDIGAVNSPWDNKWTDGTNTFDTWAAVNANAQNIFFQSSDPDFIPFPNGAPFLQFGQIPTSGNFPWQCPGGNGANRVVPVSEEKNMVITALTDTTILPQYDIEIDWAHRMNLYRLLLNDDTLKTSDSLLIAFYDSANASDMAMLLRATNALAMIKSGNMAAASSEQEGIADSYLDSLNNFSSNIIPEQAWKQVLTVAYQKQLDTVLMEETVSAKIRSVLQELFPDSVFNAELKKDERYNHAQKNQLESIAIQCPYEYGPAVYMARAMLAKSDSVPFQYIHWCELTDSGSNKTDENNISSSNSASDNLTVRVYPNPANNDLTVEINTLETDNSVIEFWSLTGAKVKEHSLHPGKNDFNVSGLSGGVYYFAVKVNQENKFNGKQVIIK